MIDDLVLLATYSNDMDADLAKGHIESAGIEAVIIKDDAGGMLPPLQKTEGVKLMVTRSNSEKATIILQERNLL